MRSKKDEMRFKPDAYYNTEVAEKLGVPAAQILNKIERFMLNNREEGKDSHYIDGTWWVCLARSSVKKALRVYSMSSIKRALKLLDTAGLILIQRFDQCEGDQTNWFTLHPQAEGNLANYKLPCSNWPDTDEYLGQDEPRTWVKMNQEGVQNEPRTWVKMNHDLVQNEPLIKGVKSSIREKIRVPKSILTTGTEDFAGASRAEPSVLPSPLAQGGCELKDASLQQNDPSNSLTVPTRNIATPKKSKPITEYIADEETLGLAKAWLEHSLRKMPWKTDDPSWSEKKYSLEIDKIKRVMKMTTKDVKEVFNYISGHEFWSTAIISPTPLLGRSPNGNRKIENVLVKMRPKHLKDKDSIEEAVRVLEERMRNEEITFS